MKRILTGLLLGALMFGGVTHAANQTPGDNSRGAENRTVPQQMKMHSLSLTDATVSNVNIEVDAKTASVYCTGDDVLINVSYYDGSSHDVGDLITTGTDKKILRVFDGTTFNILQNTEFTHIYGRVADSSGSATCYFFPGGGFSQ